MGETITLQREEKLGLGIAVAAHVALALVFVLQDDSAPNLANPERMTVNLASEVSLESTAPDPSADPESAFAPNLADEVVEAPVETSETAVEAPTEPIAAPPPPPRPAARPQPSPTPAPRTTRSRPDRQTPAPQPSRTASASRLSDDFLEGASASDGTQSGSPAARFGPAEQASLAQAITRQLRPHWSAPSGVDADRLVSVIAWELNPDGSLKGRPRLVAQRGVNDSNRPQASLHAERAIRAVTLAAPFNLPEQFYSRWDDLEWEFDRRL